MSGRYPILVELAWGATEQLIRDWQQNPYRWDQEIDIQVELASRLSEVCRLTGHQYVQGNYPDALPGFQSRQLWGRVACEPRIRYRYSDGEICTCQPDVVIWSEIDDSSVPPDLHDDNWPVMWACELKYDDEDRGDWDAEKLRYLVRQGAIQYGCWVRLFRERAASGSGLIWKRDAVEGKVWTCDARVPVPPPSRTS